MCWYQWWPYCWGATSGLYHPACLIDTLYMYMSSATLHDWHTLVHSPSWTWLPIWPPSPPPQHNHTDKYHKHVNIYTGMVNLFISLQSNFLYFSVYIYSHCLLGPLQWVHAVVFVRNIIIFAMNYNTEHTSQFFRQIYRHDCFSMSYTFRLLLTILTSTKLAVITWCIS